MKVQRLQAVGRRLGIATALFRSVQPRSSPSRQALCVDAALAALVLGARLANGEKGIALLIATAPLPAWSSPSGVSPLAI